MAKVLIVDDLPDNVRLMAYILEERGYEMLLAYSGREALEIASAERPDAILLDVMMPGLGGIEVCRRLKADEELRMIPVILVTARDLDEDVVRGLDAGADDYVAKPFRAEVLAARVRSAIRLKTSHDAVRKKDEQLRQAQKLEAVGLLAGGIAHEFNNLLQAIGGYANCALEGLLPHQQRYQDLQQVLKASDRATTLTRQLLGFSRRQTLRRRNIDPRSVVTDLVKMLRPIVGEQISLELRLGEDVRTVDADPGELQEALLNLCLNARDAMPCGGRLLLKVDTVILSDSLWDPRFSIEPGPHVVFSVTDTGCGIPAELQHRIFEPFFTTKEVGKGTGLGLATVYGIVQQHKGAIHLYSEPGKGTTFKLYFPAGDKNREAEHAEEPQPALGGGETILVAEDEPVVRSLAVRILEQAGYTVLSASDGQEALRIFEEHGSAISLIVLDAVMPKLTGLEVYQRIKAEHPEKAFVFASGYDPETSRSKVILQEKLRLIAKPFDASTLLRTVREVLDEEAQCTLAPQTTS